MNPTLESVVKDTNRWLETIVIGLNLCPFAKAIHAKSQIRFVVSSAIDTDTLINDFQSESKWLRDADPADVESTLLIHPNVLNDFDDYNLFLARCDQAVLDLDLEGILQVASFHPHYRFAGTRSGDVTNYTNRSPYPMLHLLREESVTRAVESFPNIEGIKKNMATLKSLGTAKMDAMLKCAMRPESGTSR
jgi:uncharacterized protein